AELEEIEELVEYVEGELSNEDLIELETERLPEEEPVEEGVEEIQRKFTGLADVFSNVNAALLKVEDMD
ncbi:hypothetical protein QE152_g36903, partial [Popillia japonica]